MASGATDNIRGPLAKAAGFDLDTIPTKNIEFLREQSGDQKSHSCDLVIHQSTTTKTLEPLSLVFRVGEKHETQSTSYHFRTNLNGEIEKAFAVYGTDDAAGKPIKGSGHLEVLDIKSRDVRKRLQHELDFWLKGMYHKR